MFTELLFHPITACFLSFSFNITLPFSALNLVDSGTRANFQTK